MTILAKLLEPIAPDTPAGADLRLVDGGALFVDLRELRRRESATTAAPGVTPKEANFRAVDELCSEALEHKTKDLELAVYLVEAWVAMRGFEGLADGLELLRGFVDEFWSGLWPGLEVENGELVVFGPIRAKWLNWVGGAREFLDTLRATAITGEGEAAMTLATFESAERMEEKQRTDTKEYEGMRASGFTTPEEWDRAVEAAGLDRIAAHVAAVERCLALIDELDALCREKLESDAPSFLELREQLEMVARIQARATRGVVDVGDAGEDASTDQAAPAGATSAAVTVSGAHELRSRADVVDALRRVARFMRDTEPHSPVSFLVERCVTWLNMSYEELTADLVENDTAMETVRKTLGIRSPDDDDED